MARIEHSVVIERPVEEVFAYITDPANDAAWNGPIVETVQTSEGPMGVGTTMRSTASFLGKRFDTDLEVTEYELNRRECVRTVSGPISGAGCYIVEPFEGGSRFTSVWEAEMGGFFKLAEPLVIRAGNRQTEADLATLKDILEAGDQGILSEDSPVSGDALRSG